MQRINRQGFDKSSVYILITKYLLVENTHLKGFISHSRDC